MKEFGITFDNKEFKVNYSSEVPSSMHQIATTTSSLAVLRSIDTAKDKCFIHPIHLEADHLEVAMPLVLNQLSAGGLEEVYLLAPSSLRDVYVSRLKGAVATYFSQTDSFLIKFQTNKIALV